MYPGLASFPQKDLADKYHREGLHGAMLWSPRRVAEVGLLKVAVVAYGKTPWPPGVFKIL